LFDLFLASAGDPGCREAVALPTLRQLAHPRRAIASRSRWTRRRRDAEGARHQANGV